MIMQNSRNYYMASSTVAVIVREYEVRAGTRLFMCLTKRLCDVMPAARAGQMKFVLSA